MSIELLEEPIEHFDEAAMTRIMMIMMKMMKRRQTLVLDSMMM
jgi:ABC-type cobalamin/Fe3+-siderophores transport system ATPase subunit